MPALKNLRHEKFVRGLVTGMSQRKAYLQAGYSGDMSTVDPAASHLARNCKVEQRIGELLAPEVKKAQVTITSLLAEIDTTVRDARAAGQHSAAIQGLTLAAKLAGLLRDKVELGGPGAFDALQTPEQVLEKVRLELGETAFRMLQASNEREPEPKAIDNMGR